MPVIGFNIAAFVCRRIGTCGRPGITIIVAGVSGTHRCRTAVVVRRAGGCRPGCIIIWTWCGRSGAAVVVIRSGHTGSGRCRVAGPGRFTSRAYAASRALVVIIGTGGTSRTVYSRTQANGATADIRTRIARSVRTVGRRRCPARLMASPIRVIPMGGMPV